MTDTTRLKARLLKLKERLTLYACHGVSRRGGSIMARPKTYCIKSGSQWFQLIYEGHIAQMVPYLIPERYTGPFTYAAEFGTRRGAEKILRKYQPRFTETLEIVEVTQTEQMAHRSE